FMAEEAEDKGAKGARLLLLGGFCLIIPYLWKGLNWYFHFSNNAALIDLLDDTVSFSGLILIVRAQLLMPIYGRSRLWLRLWICAIVLWGVILAYKWLKFLL